MIHWQLCGVHGLDRADKWYEHQSQSVLETDKTKVLWDFNIQCDHVIEARRPDIMVVGKEDRVLEIIDVAVPADCRVNGKESEKIEKYQLQDFKREITTMWAMWKVGALGAIPKGLNKSLQNIGIRVRPEHVQKTALLGTARILRRVLEI